MCGWLGHDRGVPQQHQPTSLLTLTVVTALDRPSGILVPILCHHSHTHLAVLPWREQCGWVPSRHARATLGSW